jgi:RimJ/RimL family protein N-acetyltransferase
MKPVTLTTPRLVLDLPTLDDVDLTTEYCQDPIFEKFMLTPWPYDRTDAEKFLGFVVPVSWKDDSEFTWAIRRDDVFLGVVGYRAKRHDIGYWLGSPHRGHGYMVEAVTAVADWVFAELGTEVLWECIPGNVASRSVAYKAGFTWDGLGPSLYADRDGNPTEAWRGSLAPNDSREPKPGWPTD